MLTVATAARAVVDVQWQAHDDLPIAEPAADPTSEHLWRDGAWTMTVYQLRRLFAGSREAANVNALDEVPDSTWFTNRHGRHRLSPAELARGPNRDRSPSERGPLVVLSGKPSGMTPGFVMRDAKGDRYVVKLDPPAYPEVPTGAEMVCTKIVHALGWNVPENYLVRFDPARLVVAPDAWLKDGNGRKRPLTAADLRELMAHAGRLPDGRVRALASRWVPGTAKGGFLTLGRRADDPDDTVPHEDRRELRGLRVVAAWINYTDARRGNFLDTFVPDPRGEGRGHLVHYLLDFSSALGSGNDDWKPRRYGHEYYFDPPAALLRVVTLGLLRPAWARVPLAHPALGYLDAESFDPEEWRTTYPNPLFDHATVRDAFWGAKLVSALDDDDLAVVTRAGEWSDPRTAEILARILRERQRKIARAYFDWRRVNPLDGFVVAGDRLGARDLAVENGVAAADAARYRWRAPGGGWTATGLPLQVQATASPVVIELATSHDGGASWSPPTRVSLEPGVGGVMAVSAVERETR